MPRPPGSQNRNNNASVSAAASGVLIASPRKRPACTKPSKRKRIRVKTETENTSPTEATIAKSTTTMNPFSGAIVDFKIGENQDSFAIHQDLLCRASTFWNEQLSTSETKEGEIVAQVIELHNGDPQIFLRFHIWLYSEKITSESESCKDIPWRIIINVYAFAERNGIPRLQNTCIDTAIRKITEGGLFPNQVDVNALWKCKGDVFRLRRLLLDLFASECNLGQAIANNGSLHSQFLGGLVQVLYDMKVEGTTNKEVDFWRKRHDYYVNGTDNPIVVD